MKILARVLFTFSAILSTHIAVAQYQINGNTVQTSCNCYRLTSAANSQNGSVWNVNLFDLSTPFDFGFDVYLGCNDGGADGIAFVLQPLSVNAGSSGGGIGYAGISPSLAVEMDTYQNASDPGYDHIAIQANGSTTHSGANNLSGPVQASAATGNIEDCAWHLLRVVWDPVTMTMTVYFDGVLRLTYTGDIVNNIFGGNPNVYWGLTAATGGANNLQQFCNALSPSFAVTPAQQCEGDPVTFQNTSVVATNLISNYDWDFGDGTTGTGISPTHTYSGSGTFTVTLTITSEGCMQSSTGQVTISPSPDASVGTDLSICDGASTQLSPTNLTPGASYLWTPALGLDNPAVATPNASPNTTSTYTLTVTDAGGCISTDDLTLTVNPLPVADAGADQAICDGNTTAMAGSGGTTYSWNPTGDLMGPTDPATPVIPSTTTTYTLTVTDGNGCQDTDDMTLTVNPVPVVNAGADDGICDGQTIQLGVPGVLNYSWSPAADLDNAAAINPIFSGSATTTFTLTGTDANGCISIDNVTITVFPLPVAGFVFPADVCLGNPTDFTNNSTGNGLAYQWDFGDGSVLGTDISPTYTYTSDAVFNVNLSVTDVNGCSDNVAGTATVLPLPTAAMNIVSGAEFCEQESIQFTDMSTGGIDVFWNFGDNAFLPAFPNTTSTLSDPQFAYPNFAFSPFTVTVSVTDAAGCYDQTTATIIIHDRPWAAFDFNIACEGQLTDLVDGSTVQGASTVNTWEWDVDDGSNPFTSQDVSHGYATDGSYHVVLIAETDNGCTDTTFRDIWVNPTPVMAISGIDTCLDDVTAFENNSSPQNNTIVSWDWDLGDTNVSSDMIPTHTYMDHGQFPVSLTATSDSGCVATGSTVVEVFPNPEPDFSIPDPEGCTPHEVLFIDQSSIATGFNAQYDWDFGDGNSGLGGSPINTYIDSGYYDITLSVTSSEGCNTVLAMENAVRANITPEADFRMNDDVFSLLDARLELTDLSLHALEWYWTFGDGASSTTQNPEHRFDGVGTYDIVLTVVNGDCEDTQIRQIKVEPIFTFYIPSAFTPDDNSHNETFFGNGEGITEYNMRIFDRWGEMLFESNKMDSPWDGSYKGLAVEAGVYVYEFYVLDLTGQDHKYKGHFVLLR